MYNRKPRGNKEKRTQTSLTLGQNARKSASENLVLPIRMVTITQYGLPLESWPKQQNKKHKIVLISTFSMGIEILGAVLLQIT